ncbi:glycosyltransferase [Azospirillum sp. Marseille-Q6669]
MEPRISVDLLLRSRRYGDALRYLENTAENVPRSEFESLRRQILARMGRFRDAAEAGFAALEAGATSVDDVFRQSQILIECGAWENAFRLALDGFARAPAEHRFLGPLAQAALAAPHLLDQLYGAMPKTASAPPLFPRRFFIPQRMPYYTVFDADHPGTTGMLTRTQGLDIHFPSQPDPGWLNKAASEVERTLPTVEALCAAHPKISRADAARFLGAKLIATLPDAGGSGLDFLTNLPLTTGHRPFVLWFDVLPALFQPFVPFDSLAVSSEESPLYWMMRTLLESNYCLSIITHYPLDGNPLTRLFRSTPIAEKLVFVNPCEAELVDGEVSRPPPKPMDGPLRLLFTASHRFTDEGFFYRGGVDVLCAFLDLAEEHEDIELVLRTPLPATLSPRLRAAAAAHPRIRWMPEPLAKEDYQRLVARTHLFVMPASVVYRNGVVHAMKDGIVPVVSDIVGMDALVENGVTGVVVPGRGGVLEIADDPPGVRQDLCPILWATDRPCDPAFHSAFRAALHRLIKDRATLAAMSARASVAARQTWSSAPHMETFRSCMIAAADRAEAMWRTEEPLRLPVQRL